jgi:leucyl/phenylalanyl-tRNA--protein transferase
VAEPGDDLVGFGADLAPGTILAAYRRGLFPMNAAPDLLGWWSPDPRGVLPLDALRVTRSLRRSRRRFAVTVDAAFSAVIEACADPSRPDGWIDAAFIDAYERLHDLGWAHSVEVWADDSRVPELAGGLYGLAVGGLFAGESMFHRRADASKVALVELVERLGAGGGVLLDVQWRTPHLGSLGAIEMKRTDYLELLADALARPQLVLDP